MAKILLSVQQISRAGLDATYRTPTSGTDGDSFDNSTRRILVHVKNGSGASVDVTFVTQAVVDGSLAVDDRVEAVPAGDDQFFGPFGKEYESKDTDNDIDQAVQIKWSAVTSIEVAALELPKV